MYLLSIVVGEGKSAWTATFLLSSVGVAVMGVATVVGVDAVVLAPAVDGDVADVPLVQDRIDESDVDVESVFGLALALPLEDKEWA